MAYTHSKKEEIVAKDASLASAADVGDWAPGYVPHIVRAVSLVFTTAVDATGELKVDKRPTAGSDTGRGDGDVATIAYTTTTGAQGKVVYAGTTAAPLNVKVSPGEELVFQVTDATPTAGAAHLVLYLDPVWEVPGNNTDMAATT